MSYTPDHQIGEVKLLFNSWTFRHFCRRINIELDELFNNIGEGKLIKTEHFPELLFTAAESYCKFNNLPLTYTELDAYTWIDEIGGFTYSEKWNGIIRSFMGKLLNLSPEQFEVLWSGQATEPAGDKKKAESGSPGTASTRKRRKQG